MLFPLPTRVRNSGARCATVHLALAAACGGALLSSNVHAQAFPVKPLRLISPFGAGGSNDAVARLVSPKMSEVLGQPVIVENRAGSGGVVGTEVGARANPDGYTLTVATTSTFAINPGLRKLSYDPVNDFAPVGLIGVSPYMMLTHPSMPVRTVKDLIGLAKKSPGLVEYGSGGVGTPGHLAGAAFASQTGVEFTHIPYKSGNASMTDLLAGRITLVFTTPIVVDALVQAGRLRALAVTTSTRLPRFPNVPTIAESGLPGFEFSLWLGVVAPAKTPEAVVQRLADALGKSLSDKQTASALEAQSIDVLFETPKVFAERIRTDLVTYAKIIRASGAKTD